MVSLTEKIGREREGEKMIFPERGGRGKRSFHLPQFMIKWKNQLTSRQGALGLIGELTGRYVRHGVGRSAAALTYYLVFAAFGLLAVFSRVLGTSGVGAEELLSALAQFLPSDVVELSGWYLRRISGESVGSWWSMAVLTVWFPLRASSCLLWAAERALGSGKRPRRWLRTAVFTLWLLVSMSIALALSAAGQAVLTVLLDLLGLTEELAGIAFAARYAVPAAVMFVTVWLLYRLAAGRPQKFTAAAPGIAVSLAVWLAASAIFSFYVEHIADYTRLYGAVSAVVVSLLWLYMTSAVLIMGAEFNEALSRRRKQRK